MTQVVPEGQADTYLAILFTRRTEATDLEYQVESAAEIGEWTPLDEEFATEVLPTADSTERVTYRDTVPVGEAKMRFLRVSVELIDD